MVSVDTRYFIEWELFFFGSFEPEIAGCIDSMLQSGDVAIDVGANMGVHTLRMAKRVGSQGRVVAFEPNPEVGVRLKENVRLNKLLNVEIVESAAIEQERSVRLHIPSNDNPGMSSLLPLGSWRKVDVEGTTLDSILSERKLSPTLIKIDVEGSEPLALAGAMGTLERFRPALIFEYDPGYWDMAEASLDETLGHLRDVGYSDFRIIGRRKLSRLEGKPSNTSNILALASA